MKEIASRFCLIDPEEIRQLLKDGEKVELSHTMGQFPTSGRVQFSQEPSRGDDGTSWEQSFRAVVTDPTIMVYNGIRMYVGVFCTDGTFFLIGSATETPMLTVTPYENSYVLETVFDAAEPALI